MYQGRPVIKKVTRINYNNPSLNSRNVRGIFYEPSEPTIRDELLYNNKNRFKDSLEQRMEQEILKRQSLSYTPIKSKTHSYTPKKTDAPEQKPLLNAPSYEPLWPRHKNEVLDKVTQIPMENVADSFNYQGYQTIKNKQLHGFNIIKNF